MALVEKVENAATRCRHGLTHATSRAVRRPAGVLRIRLCTFLTALSLTSVAGAEPIQLASYDFLITALVRAPIERVIFSVEYPPDTSQGCGPCPPPGPRILEREFRAPDVGTRVAATPASDPDFAAFANLLRNGSPNELLFFYEVPPGESDDYSGFGRFALDTVLFPRDWTDYRITAVSFLLTEFAFDQSNPTPIGGNIYFHQRLRGEFAVVGDAAPVPEPATLALFSIGLAGIGWRARRRHQRASGSANAPRGRLNKRPETAVLD